MDLVGRAPEIVLCVMSKTGFTARLAKLTSKWPGGMTALVLLEGPYGGVSVDASSTASLKSMVKQQQQQQDLENLVVPAAPMSSSDSVLVIAGGSGAGFSHAIIQDTLRRLLVLDTFAYSSSSYTSSAKGAAGCCCTDAAAQRNADDEQEEEKPHKLQVVYATRDPIVAQWYVDELRAMMKAYGLKRNQVLSLVSIYVTSSSDDGEGEAKREADQLGRERDIEIQQSQSQLDVAVTKEAETIANPTPDYKDPTSEDDDYGIKIYHRRKPYLPSIIAEAATKTSTSVPNSNSETEDDAETKAKAATTTRRVKTNLRIYSCGPSSMLHDVRNAAASAQVKILRNDPDVVDEVALHSECFSYVLPSCFFCGLQLTKLLDGQMVNFILAVAGEIRCIPIKNILSRPNSMHRPVHTRSPTRQTDIPPLYAKRNMYIIPNPRQISRSAKKRKKKRGLIPHTLSIMTNCSNAQSTKA